MSNMSARLAAVLALCAAAACAAHNERELQKKNSSELFTKDLRRQLMKDNYDYSSDESEDSARVDHKEKEELKDKFDKKIVPVGDKDARKEEEETHNNNLDHKDKPSIEIQYQSRSYSNAEFINKSITHKKRGKYHKKIRKKKKKGREYTYDINKEFAKRYQSRYRGQIVYEDDATERDIEHTTTVKYKVLKFKKQYRRSGLGLALIQEESPDGVSIVNLGEGPVPEFRLLGPRRQYMRVPEPLVGTEEEELPPPALDTAADESTPAGGDALIDPTTDMPHDPDSSKKEFPISLKITVTPDEIFVL